MATTTSADLGRLAGGAALTAAGGVVTGVAGFVVTAAVAAGLGAGAAGVFGVCVAVSMIVTQVGKLGCDTALVHFVPRIGMYGGPGELRRLLVWSLTGIGLLGIAAAVVGWAVAPIVADVFLPDAARDTAVTAVRMMVVGLPPASVAAVALAATRGMGVLRPLVVNDQLAKPVLRLVAVLAVVALDGGVAAAVLAWSAPQWVVLPFALRSLRDRLADTPPRADRMDDRLRRGFVRFSGLRCLSATVEIVGLHAGLLVVAALVGTAEAGIFAVASRLVLAGYLTLQAVRLAVSPQLSQALAGESVAPAQRLHQVSTGWVILSAWPLYLVLAILSPWVLGLFGPDFVAGASVLTVLAVGGLVSVAAGNIQTVLLMGGRTGDYLGVAVVSVAVNLTATALLVPWVGVVGAAYAVTLATVTENALTIGLVRRRFGLRHVGPPVLTAAAVAAGTIGVGAALARALDVSTPTLLAIMAGASVAWLAGCWGWRSALSLDRIAAMFRRGAVRGELDG
ncbi:MAG: lipopolysaccharide biosynthesis protein [Nocardioidaceae bacterium]